MQEHVFQRGPPDERSGGFQAMLAHAPQGLVAVSDVKHDAIGSRLDPFGRKIFDFLSRLLVEFRREPQLEDLGG